MTSRVLLTILALLATPAQSTTRFVLASVATTATGAPVAGLTTDDFMVEEGAERCDIVAANPAHYPVAVLIDTSQAARAEFTQLRKAARQLVSRLSGREVALYTFGDRAFRVQDFTRDTTRLERAVEQLFALPDGESHVLDTIIEAGKDLARREPAVAIIVAVSAGYNDQSNRTPQRYRAGAGQPFDVHVVDAIDPPPAASRERARLTQFHFDRALKRAGTGAPAGVSQSHAATTTGSLDQRISGSLDRLQGRLAAEWSSSMSRPVDRCPSFKSARASPGHGEASVSIGRRASVMRNCRTTAIAALWSP